MLNGFWTVTFSAATDLGAGVVTIANGKAMGGDTSFTYVGPFNASADGAVSGELHISRHSKFLPSVIPGMDDYTLLVSGRVSGDILTLTGKIKGQESQSMSIVGKKIAAA